MCVVCDLTIPQYLSTKVEYLVSACFVCAHVSVQLCTVAEGVAAQRAAEVILALLVSILDVFLQRCVALVTARAVRTGEELRERIWCACVKESRGWERVRGGRQWEEAKGVSTRTKICIQGQTLVCISVSHKMRSCSLDKQIINNKNAENGGNNDQYNL